VSILPARLPAFPGQVFKLRGAWRPVDVHEVGFRVDAPIGNNPGGFQLVKRGA
jgi:hypothetical protein